MIQICEEALCASDRIDQESADNLRAELCANALAGGTAAHDILSWAQRQLADPAASNRWRVLAAYVASLRAQPAGHARDQLAPVITSGLAGIAPDSLTAAYALFTSAFSDDLATGDSLCEAVMRAARERGSMSMVAHVSCVRSMLMRRLGQLEDAYADARLALDFKVATSPPLAVAWAAWLCIDALTCLGRLAEADEIAAITEQREPAADWIHTVAFRQALGGLRLAQQRYDDALASLEAAARGWRALGVTNPGIASWRTDAATAYAALGDADRAAALAAEQLELARQVGTPRTVGIALRAYAATDAGHAVASLTEAADLLESAAARYDLAGALFDLGAVLRRHGRPKEARAPLLRAQDLAQRTGALLLAEQIRPELLAAGARPRRTALTGPDALTSAERRVAALAASGLSNRQIAQHLFITLATVETHLRHAFGKLGITSRADLPPALAENQPGNDAGATTPAQP